MSLSYAVVLLFLLPGLAIAAYMDRIYSEMGKFLAREYQDNIDAWEQAVEPFSDDVSMKALRGGFREKAEALFAAGVDIALHCSGDRAEAEQVAAASPLLSGPSTPAWSARWTPCAAHPPPSTSQRRGCAWIASARHSPDEGSATSHAPCFHPPSRISQHRRSQGRERRLAMGSLSIIHWIIIGAVLLLFFGGRTRSPM